MTGRHPHEHGAEQGRWDFPERHPNLAQELRRAGYRTGAVSANTFWFCRAQEFDRGFSRFDDYFNSTADMAARTLLGRKFHRFVLRRFGFEDSPARRLASNVTSSALRWIGRDRSRPFFVFLNYFDPHDPYQPPQPFRSKFSKLKNPGGIINALVGREYPQMTPEQLQGEIDAYDGAIAYVDQEIGRLLAELENRGFGRNTLVVVTSDHGESFGEHGLLGHRNALYRELIQVPLILRWPSRVPAGARVTTPVSNTDLAATLMELSSQRGGVFPGGSLARLWKSGEPANWTLPLAELAQMPYEGAKRNPAYSGWLKSLVSPDWHYIVHQQQGSELYEWRADREERKNLASSSEGKLMVKQFEECLHTMLQSHKPAENMSARRLGGDAQSRDVK